MISIDHLVRVELADGVLLGRCIKNENGKQIKAFLGVPYAMPPLGSYRWRPAVSCLPWQGERLASAYSASPMQQFINDKDSPFYLPEFPISEDCLYLNVWAPVDGGSNGDAYPVMVWFYGGGLLSGTSASPQFNGAALASKGVVVVTINYRLGVFGYFSHPLLSQESSYNASGNYGTTDQIQALKWVKNNIICFGGDPDNVTIFGESAGALSVSHLMASPLAKGLFHKAIMQSPYLPAMPAVDNPVYGFESAEDTGLRFTEKLIEGSDNKEALATLRNIPAITLLNAVGNLEFDKTVIDNYVFSEQIFETFEQGRQHDVPLIVGFNQDEGSYFSQIGLIDKPADSNAYQQAIASKYGSLSQSYLRVYPANNLTKAANDSLGDGLYKWAAESFASMMDGVSSSAYLYCFNHVTEYGDVNDLGAFHSSEVVFCFNNITKKTIGIPVWLSLSPTQKDKNMGDMLSDLWVAFSRSGVPECCDMTEWKPYSAVTPNIIIFDDGGCKATEIKDFEMFQLHRAIVEDRKRKNSNWTYRNIGLLAPDS